ncbi:M1 family metallopeptidase [Gallaecimonas pentaromativorans]|uniref:M1 family metallopeptidase n=1 Tax=Gallaecimonas pentaromativorans TaxID=584787 RepID=UPI003A8E30A3
MKKSLCCLVLLLSGCAQHHESAGPKPLSPLTKESGGLMPPSQQSLHFTKAELHFKVEPQQQAIEGEAKLTFSAKAPLQTLSVDLDPSFAINAITFNGQMLAASAWHNPEGRLFITLPKEVAKGARFTLGIHYAGKPHVAKHAPWDGGFVWAKTAEGEPWIATAVQGEGCDLFWPCIDHPMGEPDVAELFITVPAPLVAPSNGAFLGMEEKDGWRTYHWQVAHPNTYAIALNIGPYEKLEATYHSRFGNSFPMDYWYLKGQKAQAEQLFAEFPRQLDFFEQTIGPYPFGNEKMGVVHTPHKGMEHQTINAYGNDYAQNIYGYDDLLQHELAHEWFGNQLTNTDWDDFWLHEGFGTYMQPLYAQYLRGDMAYDASLYRVRGAIKNKRPLVSGHSQTEEGVYDEKRGPGQDIYVKGAFMLHSLRSYLGDKRFFTAVRELVYGTKDPRPGHFAPRYGTSKEFIAIVSRLAGEDMQWFFDAYLYQAPLPKLVANRDGDTLHLSWQGTKSAFLMPVEVALDGKVYKVVMAGGKGSLKVGKAEHILLDPHQKLLRDEPHFAAFQAWEQLKREKARNAKK